ncbi:ABC transporter permease [Sphaerisporangium perillae]|uniref:ABC transporter permease n=1 Tax=Sphaerisporangium perillae TaxID=2935860 RepID=UPI00200F3FB8|nr:ABC transporter permease [Sphaerisporangium perillae]
MIWLTWRQFRAAAAMMSAALAALVAFLGLTGPRLAEDYSTGIADCAAAGGGCSEFLQQFFNDYQDPFLAVTAVVLVLPALIGLFWGAPLITRELEAGTHRLVWNQSVTRGRWLAVKLGLTGLTAMTAAGLGSLAVTWWASPIDEAAANEFPRMGPLLFGARGIVPIGYAAFAFALGVTVGMLVRRTLAAMAITLAVFVAVQIAMPLLVRPHLLPLTRSTTEITASNVDGVTAPANGTTIVRVTAADNTGGWLLSSHTVDASGHAVADTIPVSTPSCVLGAPEPGAAWSRGLSACLAEIKRLGYRQQVTYHPSSRFWPFQWYETGIYTALALGLSGFCFWWIRRRLS